jgi:hypothetical protein
MQARNDGNMQARNDGNTQARDDANTAEVATCYRRTIYKYN